MKARKIISIVVFIIGLAALAVGVVFLILNLNQANKTADGEFLVEVGEWQLEGEEGVVWNFTEIGAGTLTTNGHENDYDFIWAIEGEELKIETEWLTTLENEYEYSLDQGAKMLTLVEGDETYTFVGL